MKYMKLLGVLVASVLLATSVVAAPATNAPAADSGLGQWTLSLSGAGSTSLTSDSKYDSSAVGAQFELGHDGKFILPLTAGVRQGVAWGDSDGSEWQFTTRVFNDWTLIRLGNLQLDAGGNVGLNYGTKGEPRWVAAPEVVGRLYLKKDVDMFARVEYPFDLNAGRAENTLTYVLGVRIRF
jgi:opacity protein-like surface antigen